MAISSAARVGSIFLRCMHFHSPISRIRGKMPMPVFIMRLSCSYHAAIMRRSRYSDHAGSRSGWYAHRYRAGAKEEDIEPNTKPKPESRGLEGIPGYPHKESADHHPYNPPRKRYSPPLLLFYSLSQNFFLTKNSCSIITYTEVRDDK